MRLIALCLTTVTLSAGCISTPRESGPIVILDLATEGDPEQHYVRRLPQICARLATMISDRSFDPAQFSSEIEGWPVSNFKEAASVAKRLGFSTGFEWLMAIPRTPIKGVLSLNHPVIVVLGNTSYILLTARSDLVRLMDYRGKTWDLSRKLFSQKWNTTIFHLEPTN